MVVLQIFINDDVCGKTQFMALNKLNSTVRKRVKVGIFRRLLAKVHLKACLLVQTLMLGYRQKGRHR